MLNEHPCGYGAQERETRGNPDYGTVSADEGFNDSLLHYGIRIPYSRELITAGIDLTADVRLQIHPIK